MELMICADLVCFKSRKIEIYGAKSSIDDIKQRFPHIFGDYMPEWGWYKLRVNPNIFENGQEFAVKAAKIHPFVQTHGKNISSGFRIGNFAYSTDVNQFTDAENRAKCKRFRPLGG